MAKGDHKRVENEIDRQWGTQNRSLNQLSNQLYDTSNMFTGGYRQAMPMNLGSYDEIMHNYRQFMQNPFGGTMGYGMPAQSGYFNPAPQQFGGGQGGDLLQQVMQMAQSMPANRQSMDQIVKHFQSQGIPISIATRAGGTARSDDKLVLPDGRVIDMGGDVDEHTGQFKGGWSGNVIDIFGGNNKVVGPDGNFVNYGDYLRSQGVNNIPQGVTPELAAQYGFDMGGGNQYEGELADFYRNLMGSGAGAGWDSMFRDALGKAIGTYGEFAETGGLSERDRQDLRARAEGNVRAVYGHAVDQLNRNRALQPFSPNYNAALAKMARERSYANADVLQASNADIARMVQQGRLAGAGGLTSAGLGGQGLSTDMDRLNLQGKLAGASGLSGLESDNNAMALATAGMRLNALQGMGDLYGTTPGLTNMFGNQILGANNQLLGLNELRQGLGQQMIGGRLGNAQVPGNWSNAMGNIGSTLGLIGRGAGAFMGGLGGLNPFGGGAGGYTANAVANTANSIGGTPWWAKIFGGGGGSSGQWSPYGAMVDNFTGVSDRYSPPRRN